MAVKKSKKRDAVAHPGAQPGTIAAPVSITRQIKDNKPKFRSSPGGITITHRELMGSFINTGGLAVNNGFTGNLFRVNPSNSALFPWLQPIASNFDQYMFKSLAMHYVPLCATTETGRVALYFDKDSQDAEPTDRVEIANMAHLRETSPWAEVRLPIPMDGVKRLVNDSSTADPKLLDVGQLGVAVYGGSGSNTIGDVFVEYTVTFFEAQPSSGLVQTITTGGAGSNFGPTYVEITDLSSTQTAFNFKAPGRYILIHFQRSLTFVSFTTGNGLVVNSNTVLQSTTTATCCMFNITVPLPGGGIFFNGTGLGNRTSHVARAKNFNFCNLL